MAGLLTVNLCAVRPPLEKTGAAPTDGPLSLSVLFLRSSGISGGENKITSGGWKKWRARQPAGSCCCSRELEICGRKLQGIHIFRRMCVCVHLESVCVYEGDFFLRKLDLVSCGVTQRLFFQMDLICLSPRTWSRNFQKSNVHTRSKRAAAQRCGAALLTGTTTQDLGQLRSQRVIFLLFHGFWSNWLDFEW